MLQSIAHLHLPRMDGLTLFGLAAVSLMLVFYSLEQRHPLCTLGFACACAMGSTYGFLQGAWPFGMVEGIWTLVALRKWLVTATTESGPAMQPETAVNAFLEDLATTAHLIGPATYQFALDDCASGFVQLHRRGASRVILHRIWTTHPGNGHGSSMLDRLCELADLHGVELALRPLPFGAQPYPMEGQRLLEWYARRGFVGTDSRMIRPPQPAEMAA
jgi:hypothetical protein